VSRTNHEAPCYAISSSLPSLNPCSSAPFSQTLSTHALSLRQRPSLMPVPNNKQCYSSPYFNVCVFGHHTGRRYSGLTAGGFAQLNLLLISSCMQFEGYCRSKCLNFTAPSNGLLVTFCAVILFYVLLTRREHFLSRPLFLGLPNSFPFDIGPAFHLHAFIPLDLTPLMTSV